MSVWVSVLHVRTQYGNEYTHMKFTLHDSHWISIYFSNLYLFISILLPPLRIYMRKSWKRGVFRLKFDWTDLKWVFSCSFSQLRTVLCCCCFSVDGSARLHIQPNIPITKQFKKHYVFISLCSPFRLFVSFLPHNLTLVLSLSLLFSIFLNGNAQVYQSSHCKIHRVYDSIQIENRTTENY